MFFCFFLSKKKTSDEKEDLGILRMCLFMCEGTRENERIICQLHNSMVLGTVNILMTVL